MIDASIHADLRVLSRGCGFKVKSYDIYEVNGYRFRSEKYEKSKAKLTTINTGVLAMGIDDTTGKELEYYGIIKDIIELKFNGDDHFSIVLFDCHWFHPINGIRHLDRFGLVEVAHESHNPANEPFVLASQVTQVYYIPYACTTDRNLNAWWIAYKVRPLGSLAIPSLDDYSEATYTTDVFQEDGLEGEFIIDLGSGLDNLMPTGLDEVIDPQELDVLSNPRIVETAEIERPILELFEEENGSDSDTEMHTEINIVPFREDVDDF